MTESSQHEKLRQHFARRVTTQARLVLETWQNYLEEGEPIHGLREEMHKANTKLIRYADRFNMTEHRDAANALAEALENWPEESALNTEIRDGIQAAMDQLRQCTLRRSDQGENESPSTYLRTPIYLALNDADYLRRLISQMECFGFRASTFSTPEALREECARHKPETIVIDVNFGGDPGEVGGIETIETIQEKHDTPVPILYMSPSDGSIETRLRAVRSGGEEFFHKSVDPDHLIEKIARYSCANPVEPYKVLVIEDSRAQARFMENVLRKAGTRPMVLTDPMGVISALDEFEPEIIILDMYMPTCTGTEIAKVIRQQDSLQSVPIIYLSAEDDLSRQLHAMSMGGDDFLSKPIDPKHLIATLHNRGRRARSLLALMIRDSLTGLYNHTHTLNLLESEIDKARKSGQPLTCAMLDLDHFKRINDTHGHSTGDLVLRSLSLFLKQRLRKSDHIGRYGGEEFAVILPDTRKEDAYGVMEEIRENFSQLQQPAGTTDFTVTFSCGLVEWHDESPQELCEKVDSTLYEAKKKGRNQVITGS